MAGLTDVLSVLQNGVTSFNNLTTQMKGSFNNISSQLTTLSSQVATLQSSGVKSIAGNTGAFTLNGTSGLTITSSINDINLFKGSSSQFGAIKVDGTSISASSGVISTVLTAGPITNSLSS